MKTLGPESAMLVFSKLIRIWQRYKDPDSYSNDRGQF